MKKFLLAAFLLCASSALALDDGHGGKDKQKGHAPEMSGVAMALAGVTSLGGYLIIRRRSARAK